MHASASVPPEVCTLLRAAARRSPVTETAEISSLAAGIRDWDALLRLGRQHRILPLLASRLLGVECVPATARQVLKEESTRNMVLCLASAAELIVILRRLDQHGIRAMPFKGLVLAASVWGDISARPAGDIDLIIPFADLEHASALLEESGFDRLTEPDGRPARDNLHEFHFQRASDGLFVDLRWRLDQPRFRSNLDIEWAWRGRQTAMLCGAAVPNMSPEKTLLMLCMHGSKHLWSRLIWICDVGQLLAASSSLDWEAVLQEARSAGMQKTLALGVLLARAVCGADLPPSILRRFRSDAAMVGLATYFDDHVFTAPGQPPPGRVPYNIRLLSPGDRVRYLISTDFLRPSEPDQAWLALPRALQPLYYFLRPFRLLFDRSARS